MKVIVDGAADWLTIPADATVGKILGMLHVEAAKRDRALVTLRLDGDELSSEKQTRLEGKSADDYGLLEVTTVDPIQLSRDTLPGLIEHLENMEKAHQNASDSMRMGDFEKALEKLEGCFAGWQVLIQAVANIQQLSHLDLKAVSMEDTTCHAKFQELQAILGRFQEVFNLRDPVSVGDIAEHELIPSLQDWKKFLEAISSHLESQSGS